MQELRAQQSQQQRRFRFADWRDILATIVANATILRSPKHPVSSPANLPSTLVRRLESPSSAHQRNTDQIWFPLALISIKSAGKDLDWIKASGQA
jgi:hypothetical protein